MTRLTPAQRHAFVACFLGWALDAFDYFILVFAVKAIATDFHAQVTAVTVAITLTLAMRPVGAAIFGLAADRFGRRPTLMVNVVCYSALELLSAAAPSLGVLLVLRALYGVAMGGEWGVGAALALESVPVERRGFFSGLLQEGYMVGYLLAALAFAIVFPVWGWRGMFVVGALPALLVLYIRRNVPESPAWAEARQARLAGKITGVWQALRSHWGMFLYVVILMTAFNCFSHGTQDLYPTFLLVNRHLTPGVVGTVAIIGSLGAIAGGIAFGTFSERIGRRRAMITAALLALPIVPLWAFASGIVGLAAGAFLIQFMVQGAWGIIPAHLTELAPHAARGTFPGLAYQLGNLLASGTATVQAVVAHRAHDNYAVALAGTAVAVAIAVAALTALGTEAKGIAFGSFAASGSVG